jgi:putative ABC transport system substrate-binding protein
VRAAQKATRTVPIIFVGTNDPVGSGLVASLARPGGNTTGLASQSEDLLDKYLELVREILPRASRVAVLVNPDNPSGPALFERLFALAREMGIEARAVEAATAEGIEAAFSAIARQRPDAILMIPDAMYFDQRTRIAALTIRHRLPAVVPQVDFVAAGCLISYAANREELFRRSVSFVKRILAGANPGEIPVEQPTRFELAVNLKTAKALGIAIPQSVLLRADEVIR